MFNSKQLCDYHLLFKQQPLSFSPNDDNAMSYQVTVRTSTDCTSNKQHWRFQGLLPHGPGQSQTYLLSHKPVVVESHELCEPLLIEVKQQHQVQA